MVTTRPRAHSASNIKLSLINSRDNPAARSTPELPSMLVGLGTTVPQNLSPDDFSTTHRPRSRKPPATMTSTESKGCCSCCKKCCRCQILLVLLQVLLGCGVTGLSFYVEFYHPVIAFRETPYWAGIPLTLAGVIGMCFCCTNTSVSSETGKGCCVKALCFVFSIIAIFVNVIASVFPGIHLGRIYSYVKCRYNVSRCECFNVNSRIFLYPYLDNCELVNWEIKLYLFVIGGLCLLGSIVSLWFVIVLWKERYGLFYSGANGDTPVLKRRNPKFDIARLPPEA